MAVKAKKPGPDSQEHSPVPEHGHEHAHTLPRHEHSELRGDLRGAVRALLKVIEAGPMNSAQVKAVHDVRVIIGDVHGNYCRHENTAYEEGDRLVCQDCRHILAETGS